MERLVDLILEIALNAEGSTLARQAQIREHASKLLFPAQLLRRSGVKPAVCHSKMAADLEISPSSFKKAVSLEVITIY